MDSALREVQVQKWNLRKLTDASTTDSPVYAAAVQIVGYAEIVRKETTHPSGVKQIQTQLVFITDDANAISLGITRDDYLFVTNIDASNLNNGKHPVDVETFYDPWRKDVGGNPIVDHFEVTL